MCVLCIYRFTTLRECEILFYPEHRLSPIVETALKKLILYFYRSQWGTFMEINASGLDEPISDHRLFRKLRLSSYRATEAILILDDNNPRKYAPNV